MDLERLARLAWRQLGSAAPRLSPTCWASPCSNPSRRP